MDLDPDKVTNDLSEAARQAQILKQNTPTPPAAPQAQGVPNVSDTAGTGGGNIGIGQVPVPGEQGFTGNEQQPTGQQPSPQGGEPPQAPLQ
jgi:hypothetical protein